MMVLFCLKIRYTAIDWLYGNRTSSVGYGHCPGEYVIYIALLVLFIIDSSREHYHHTDGLM